MNFVVCSDVVVACSRVIKSVRNENVQLFRHFSPEADGPTADDVCVPIGRR